MANQPHRGGVGGGGHAGGGGMHGGGGHGPVGPRPGPGRGPARPGPGRGPARPGPGRGPVRPGPGRGPVRPGPGRGPVRGGIGHGGLHGRPGWGYREGRAWFGPWDALSFGWRFPWGVPVVYGNGMYVLSGFVAGDPAQLVPYIQQLASYEGLTILENAPSGNGVAWKVYGFAENVYDFADALNGQPVGVAARVGAFFRRVIGH